MDATTYAAGLALDARRERAQEAEARKMRNGRIIAFGIGAALLTVPMLAERFGPMLRGGSYDMPANSVQTTNQLLRPEHAPQNVKGTTLQQAVKNGRK